MADSKPKKFPVGTKVRVITSGVVGIVSDVDCSAKYQGECKHTIDHLGGQDTAPGSKLEEVRPSMAQIETFSLAELKKRAEDSGYTKITRRVDGAPTVPLKGWNGVATEAAPHVHADVWYNLDGNTVIVHKTGVPDIYYDLS